MGDDQAVRQTGERPPLPGGCAGGDIPCLQASGAAASASWIWWRGTAAAPSALWRLSFGGSARIAHAPGVCGREKAAAASGRPRRCTLAVMRLEDAPARFDVAEVQARPRLQAGRR